MEKYVWAVQGPMQTFNLAKNGCLHHRSSRNLMAPDDFKNLGLVFKDEADGTAEQNAGTKS